MVTASGSFPGTGQGGTEHDGVGPAGNGLDDVPGVAHRAVGDNVDVAAPGFIKVVASRPGHVGHGGGHGHVEPQDLAHRGGGAAPLPHQEGGGTGAHEVEGGGVGTHAADDDGHVELVDEALEVEGFGRARDVLGGDRGPADDEEVNAGLDDCAPVPLGLPGAEAPGDHDAGGADLGQAGGNELGEDRGPVDLLEDPGGVLRVGFANAGEGLGGVLVAGPQAFEIQHANAPKLPHEDRGAGAHDRVHG